MTSPSPEFDLETLKVRFVLDNFDESLYEQIKTFRIIKWPESRNITPILTFYNEQPSNV